MSDRFAYIGIKPCGCTVAAVIDDPKYAKDTAESVADFIKSGYRIERVACDEARFKLKECKHGKNEKLFV